MNYKQSETGFLSKIILNEKSNEDYFPVYISAYLVNGRFKTITAPGWGETIIETEEKVLYVMADKDIDFLDYNRSNNIYPGQITPVWSDHYWLKNGEAILTGVNGFMNFTPESQTIGIGPEFFNRYSWSFFIAPTLHMPVSVNESLPLEEQYKPGGIMELGFQLPRHSNITFSLLYTYPDMFDFATITLSKQIYLKNDIGTAADYYYPGFFIYSKNAPGNRN